MKKGNKAKPTEHEHIIGKEKWDKWKFLGQIFVMLAVFLGAVLYMIHSENAPIIESVKNMKDDVAQMKRIIDERLKSKETLVFMMKDQIAEKVKKECLK